MSRLLPFLFVSLIAFRARADSPPEPDSEEQALIDILSVYDDPNPRPSHVSPALPGSFGELAEPHLLALEKSWRELGKETQDDIAVRKAVFAGVRPLSDLPAMWVRALEADRAHVDGLLRATHASTGRLPRGLTFYGMFSKEPAPGGVPAAQYAVKLASVEVVQAVANHSPAATAICLDQLALARDISRGALVGQMVAAAMTNIAQPGCALALRSASAPERAAFRRELGIIRSGWTSMATTFRQETAFFDLMCIDQLSDDVQKRIPENARLYFSTEQKRSWGDSLRIGLFGGWARRAHVRSLRELEAATTLPPREADPILHRVSKKTPLAMSLAYGGGDSSSDWTGFVRRARTTQSRLAMLDAEAVVLDARDRLGRWPISWQEVGVAAPLDPRTDLPLHLVPESSGVRIQPEPDGERTQDDVGLSVR